MQRAQDLNFEDLVSYVRNKFELRSAMVMANFSLLIHHYCEDLKLATEVIGLLEDMNVIKIVKTTDYMTLYDCNKEFKVAVSGEEMVYLIP